MLPWTLLCLSWFLALMSAWTWVSAPTLLGWKLAIIVGEFGHYLGVLMVSVAFLAWVKREQWPWYLVAFIILASSLSLIGFLRPVILARQISVVLPARLAEAFGPIHLSLPALDITRLFASGATAKVPIEVVSVPVASGRAFLKIDFYRAGTTAGRMAPCVVVVHGGGWDNGDRKQLPWLNYRLAQQGYAVAAVSYRLAPSTQWPGQRDDILSALAYLKNEADRLGIDRTRFVFLGRSAGGQLATAVAYGAQDRSIRGVIAYYSPFDLRFAWEHSSTKDTLDSFTLMRQYLGGSPEEKPESYAQANAHRYLSPRTPPTLLIHGELDTLVWHRHSVRLAQSLQSEGVPHVFLSLPWATHGFDFYPYGPGGQLSTYAVEHFLAAVTR